MFFQLRNDLSKLQEHGQLSELELSSRADTGRSSDVLLAVGELTSTLNMVVKRLKSTSSTSDSARLKAV